MTPSNCFLRVTLAVKDNFDYAVPEPVYFHSDIIKSILVGDSYMRLLTSLKTLFFLTLMFGMKRKTYCIVTIIKLKILLRVLGPGRSVLIMHS